MTQEEKLIRLGWQKQGIYDEPRLSEIVQIYEEIGCDVKLAPAKLDELSGCTECMEANISQYKTVYTRKII